MGFLGEERETREESTFPPFFLLLFPFFPAGQRRGNRSRTPFPSPQTPTFPFLSKREGKSSIFDPSSPYREVMSMLNVHWNVPPPLSLFFPSAAWKSVAIYLLSWVRWGSEPLSKFFRVEARACILLRKGMVRFSLLLPKVKREKGEIVFFFLSPLPLYFLPEELGNSKISSLFSDSYPSENRGDGELFFFRSDPISLLKRIGKRKRKRDNNFLPSVNERSFLIGGIRTYYHPSLGEGDR